MEGAEAERQPAAGELRRQVAAIDPILVALILAAFALRLAWVLSSPVEPIAEGVFYHTHAVDIAAGEGLRHPETGAPTAFLPPGYPVVLGAVYVFTGDSLLAAGILNAVIGAGTVAMAYLLGRRVYSRAAGLWAAAAFAFFPSQVLYTPAIHSDGLATFLGMAAVVAALGAPVTRWRIAGTGALLAAAVLTSSQTLLLLPAIGVIWMMRYSWRPGLRSAALLGLATVLLLAPWTVRNWVQLGEPVPLSTNGGVNLWIGNNPDARGDWMPWPGSETSGWAYPADEVRTDREFRNDAIRYALTHPVATVDLWRMKLLYTFEQDWMYLAHLVMVPRQDPLDARMEGPRLESLTNRYYETMVVLALGGLAMALVRGDRRLYLLPVVVALTVTPVAFFGLDRYHVPLLPVFCALAGGYLAAIPEELRRLAAAFAGYRRPAAGKPAPASRRA